MKRQTLTVILLAFGTAALSAQHSLTVNISNIPSSKGQVEIGLFNTEKNFLKAGAQYLKKKIRLKGKSLQYTFQNLPKGKYAVAVFHDENDNSKCDTNLIGIPTEAYGFSNNFRPKLSAPSFSQTSVMVDSRKSIDIRLLN